MHNYHGIDQTVRKMDDAMRKKNVFVLVKAALALDLECVSSFQSLLVGIVTAPDYAAG